MVRTEGEEAGRTNLLTKHPRKFKRHQRSNTLTTIPPRTLGTVLRTFYCLHFDSGLLVASGFLPVAGANP
jgi:hypothetical protein